MMSTNKSFVTSSSQPYKRRALLVATTTDAASLNIHTQLTSKSYLWKDLEFTDENTVSIKESISCRQGGTPTYLWLQNSPLLQLNEPHKIFAERCGVDGDGEIDEVVFLSRHAAASKTASLTVHPIGVPWLSEPGTLGGLPGRCSPPSPRISHLFRSLLSVSKLRSNLEATFQITLEATHHGPYCSVPTCFVEIGSTEEFWSNKDAGEAWADILEAHLGLSSLDPDFQPTLPSEIVPIMPSPDPAESIVVVVIGGGHYTPKLNDAAKLGEQIYCGHALATYTLEGYFDGTAEGPIEGGWEAVIDEAISSTKITHPDSKLIVFLDKKAFGSAGKKLISSHLEKQGIMVTNTLNDVKSLLKC